MIEILLQEPLTNLPNKFRDTLPRFINHRTGETRQHQEHDAQKTSNWYQLQVLRIAQHNRMRREGVVSIAIPSHPQSQPQNVSSSIRSESINPRQSDDRFNRLLKAFMFVLRARPNSCVKLVTCDRAFTMSEMVRPLGRDYDEESHSETSDGPQRLT